MTEEQAAEIIKLLRMAQNDMETLWMMMSAILPPLILMSGAPRAEAMKLIELIEELRQTHEGKLKSIFEMSRNNDPDPIDGIDP